MALQSKVISSGKPCRTCTDNRYLLICFGHYRDLKFFDIPEVAGHSLKVTDTQRLIHLSAIAGLLAGGIAHTSNTGREGICLSYKLISCLVLPFSYQFDVPGHIGMGWTGIHTGRLTEPLFSFVYDTFLGNSLRKVQVYCLSCSNPLIKFVRYDDGASLHAESASRTLLPINKSCLSPYLDLKLPYPSRDFFDLGIGQELYVGV